MRDIHPDHIDPNTNRPYDDYSDPCLAEPFNDDEDDYRCTACGRPELDCSRDPCLEVLKDRGEWE